ncbi:MAG: hypothetical protein IIT38_04495, partial [Bacteroidales bacterium]|nr:hypothetical protein [Bacteroidales bacterium]
MPTLSIINSVILRFDTSTGSLRQTQCAAVGEAQRAVIVNCSLSIVHCQLKHVCQPHQRIESLCAVVVPDVVVFYPRVCAACGEALLKDEETVCLKCRYTLPHTGYELNPDNPLAQSFYG